MTRRHALVALCLGALFAADVLFILVNVAALDSAGQRQIPSLLHVGAEWSLPESVQYAKWTVLAAILGIAFFRSRQSVYGLWGLAFAAMAVDDSMDLHVRAGARLRRLLSPGDMPGLWELAPMAVAAGAVFLGLWLLHRSRHLAARARRYSRWALALGLLYGVFGVGVDGLHSLYRRVYTGDTTDATYRLVDTSIELLEDGGELLTATILLAFTLTHFYLRPNRPRPPATSRSAFERPSTVRESEVLHPSKVGEAGD